jgi:hypothetical protein
MKRLIVIAAAALLAVILGEPAEAQSAVAGTYAIEYPVRMMLNGEPAPNEVTARVKLVLEQKGDSVFGTWQLNEPRQGPTQQLRGTLDGKSVRLWTTSEAKLRGPDGERSVSMNEEYVITIEGDIVKGSITVHPPEGVEIRGPARTFSGKRSGD